MPEKLALFGGKPAVTRPQKVVWPPVSEEEIAEVVRMMRDRELSYYGCEGHARRLEEAFCAYLGTRYALSVNSGTNALLSAFFAAKIGPGDEVLAPTYTFLATVMPIFVCNGIPVLVDADPDTGNMDPEDLERRISPRAKAIVVTHLWGHPCDMEAILRIARAHDLVVIEDCSHAHGAICDGRKVGTLGDIGVFSLQAKKLVSAGQGGILVTDNQEMYERATLLGHFKVRAQQEVKSPFYRRFAGTGYGLNLRIHPLGAAMAHHQVSLLDARIAARHANFDGFSERLRAVAGIEPPPMKRHCTRHSLYSYKPLYRPDELGGLPADVYVEALRAEGVDIERSETPPLHREPIFQVEDDGMVTYGRPDRFVAGGERRVYRDGDLPGSERYSSRALVLPPFTEPATDTLDQYLDAFQKVANQAADLLEHWRARERRRVPPA